MFILGVHDDQLNLSDNLLEIPRVYPGFRAETVISKRYLRGVLIQELPRHDAIIYN